MQDGIDLNRAIVCPPEEDPQVADPEATLPSCLHSLEVPNAYSGVLIDGANDPGLCWCLQPLPL